MSAPQLTAVPNQVPFLDLDRIHRDLSGEILGDIERIIEAGDFINGVSVEMFEREFAAYCGMRDCVGVSSGLDALRLALLASGARPGDEVLVPANTFIATVEAVVQAGCRPILVDAAESDYGIDASAAAEAVGPATRFLMPVHMYGQMADIAALADVARTHDLILIEDACQAHGARRDGALAGTVGIAGAFSFYPGKNLGAFGDAGAVVTPDPELADRVRALREHGQRRKYAHELLGYTGRLDTIQAAVLLRKLVHLDRWNAERAAIAAKYHERLADVDGVILPAIAPGSDPVWHLYVVRVSDPEGLASHLLARGIRTGRHYPEALHLSEACRELGYERGDFPVAERLAEEVISLPMFPGMSVDEVDAVARAVTEYVRRG